MKKIYQLFVYSYVVCLCTVHTSLYTQLTDEHTKKDIHAPYEQKVHHKKAVVLKKLTREEYHERAHNLLSHIQLIKTLYKKEPKGKHKPKRHYFPVITL